MPYTLLGALLAYRRLGRGRLRMVLEAIEDHQRGWRNGKTALAEERVTRGTHTIEHVLPRKWLTHWPQPDGPRGEAARDRLVHTFGNLTLLTGKLNAKVSNGPWLGVGGKREGLDGHSVLLLNRELLKKAGDQWTDEAIRARTQELAEVIIQIWPVPQDHRSGFSPDRPRLRKKVQLSDLVNGGALTGCRFAVRRQRSCRYAAQIQVSIWRFRAPRFATHPKRRTAATDQRPAARPTVRRSRGRGPDVEDEEADDDGDDEVKGRPAGRNTLCERRPWDSADPAARPALVQVRALPYDDRFRRPAKSASQVTTLRGGGVVA